MPKLEEEEKRILKNEYQLFRILICSSLHLKCNDCMYVWTKLAHYAKSMFKAQLVIWIWKRDKSWNFSAISFSFCCIWSLQIGGFAGVIAKLKQAQRQSRVRCFADKAQSSVDISRTLCISEKHGHRFSSIF